MLTVSLHDHGSGRGLIVVEGLEVHQEALVQLAVHGSAALELVEKPEAPEFLHSERFGGGLGLWWFTTNGHKAEIRYWTQEPDAEFNVAVREIRVLSSPQPYAFSAVSGEPIASPGSPQEAVSEDKCHGCPKKPLRLR